MSVRDALLRVYGADRVAFKDYGLPPLWRPHSGGYSAVACIKTSWMWRDTPVYLGDLIAATDTEFISASQENHFVFWGPACLTPWQRFCRYRGRVDVLSLEDGETCSCLVWTP